MSETPSDHTSTPALRTGTRVAIMVGVPFIIVAAYFLFAPVYLEQAGGGVFRCGTAASGNVESETVCGSPESLNRLRAIISLVIGIVVILLGFALFGVNRDGDWDDDIDLEDGRREGRALDDESRQAGRRRDGRHRDRDDEDDERVVSRRRRDDVDDVDDEPRARRSDRARSRDLDDPRSRRSQSRDDRCSRTDDDWDLDRR